MFPDGPNYVPYVNTRDIVPMAFGLGLAEPLSHPGRGAVVHTFTEGKPLRFGVAHGLDDTYLMHRVPFENARRGQF